MSIERNKQVVLSWFEAVNRGDEDAIRDMTPEDFSFKTMARAPEWLLYDSTREEFARMPSTMSTLLVSPIQWQVNDITAKGARGAVEAETDSLMLSGKRYNNAYHFVFKLRDGRFYEVCEYSFSHLAQGCFGAITPLEPEASRMAIG